MSSRTRRTLALVLWAVAVFSVIASSLLLVNTPVDVRSLASESVAGDLADRIAFLGVATMGTIILLRRPDVRYGWVLLVAGLGFPLANLTSDYAVFAVRVQEGLPGGEWAGWMANWTWLLTWVAMPFSFLLFPDGRLPSHRWRPFAWWAALVGAVAFLLTGFTDIPLNALPELGNPVGIIPVADGAEGAWFGPVFVALMGTALISIVSLIVRFVGSRDDERQQLKWLVFAASLLGAYLVAVQIVPFPPLWNNILGALTSVVLAVAIGVAVLKYRLYDIDVVISRSLVFAGLAGFITAIYVGIVVGIGTLLGAGGEPNLGLSIVATAVVAVAFQPVRERLTRLANRLVFGKRATPYEVLSRFSSHLGDTVATEDTLQRMARLLADGTGGAHAQVSLAIAGQMIPAASVGQVADASAEAHTVEVTHQGETLGALSVTKKRGESLTPADVKLVDDLAAQAGLLLRNVRLTEELKQKIVDLRASRQRLVAAQDAERRRLERDLHDGAQQQIVAMKLKLGIARTLAEREGAPKTVALVEQLAEQTDEAVQTLRELAHGIYPPLLAAEGLTSAISTAARRAPVPVTVEADGIGRYDQDVEAAVYFCVLEAITNAAKYAEPNQITIRLQESDGQLAFDVADDGTGFDPATTTLGHGLTNMTDRLDALGGQLRIDSGPERGSTVAGSLLLTTEEPVAS